MEKQRPKFPLLPYTGNWKILKFLRTSVHNSFFYQFFYVRLYTARFQYFGVHPYTVTVYMRTPVHIKLTRPFRKLQVFPYVCTQ